MYACKYGLHCSNFLSAVEFAGLVFFPSVLHLVAFNYIWFFGWVGALLVLYALMAQLKSKTFACTTDLTKNNSYYWFELWLLFIVNYANMLQPDYVYM